jgi:hypothetical protein
MEKKRMNVKHVPSDLEVEYTTDEIEESGSRAGEIRQNYWVGKTNKFTKQFIEDRYVVLKDFIPKEIIDMTLDSWKAIESNQKYHDMFFPEPEIEITHDSPENSLRKSEGCYCFPPAISLHHWLRNALREVLDIHLGETYSYTRKYVRGAYLKSHTDRPSCEISVTLCLDYKTDDNTPWKIWVQNDQNYIDRDKEGIFEETQGLPVRKRTGKSVSLEPGDLLLYQGPNIPHWRDYLIGDYSYHMFLHFVNLKGKIPFTEYGDVPLRPDNNYQYLANKNGRHVLSYDGRENRWDCSGNSNTEKKKDMEKWIREIYSPMPNKADYVNCYNDIHFKEKKKKK